MQKNTNLGVNGALGYSLGVRGREGGIEQKMNFKYIHLGGNS